MKYKSFIFFLGIVFFASSCENGKPNACDCQDNIEIEKDHDELSEKEKDFRQRCINYYGGYKYAEAVIISECRKSKSNE